MTRESRWPNFRDSLLEAFATASEARIDVPARLSMLFSVEPFRSVSLDPLRVHRMIRRAV